MFLFSNAGIIQLVNLSGNIIRESQVINGNQCLHLIGLPRGIFVAQSDKELFRVVNMRQLCKERARIKRSVSVAQRQQ